MDYYVVRFGTETFKMITEIFKIGADWCLPCKQMDKELKDFALVPVKYFDADDNTNLCDKYNIKNLPTLLFMSGEDVVYRHTGFMTRKQIETKIQELNEAN